WSPGVMRVGEMTATARFRIGTAATLVGWLHSPLNPIPGPVVDDGCYTSRGSLPSLFLSATRRDEAPRPSEPRELRSIEANSAGGACHQNIATFQRAVGEQRKVCGHGWHAEACAQFQGDRGWHPHRLGRWQANVL